MTPTNIAKPGTQAIYPLTVILLVDQGKSDAASIVTGSMHFASSRSANSISIIEMIADHIQIVHRDEDSEARVTREA